MAPYPPFRKDCSPDETVSRIKALLGTAGISVREVARRSSGPRLHSVRVELTDLPGSGCNGKGTTEERALASGYAELMERLQNRFLPGFMPRYGHQADLAASHDPPDLARVPLRRYLENHSEILEWFIEPPLSVSLFPDDCEVLCLPYLDLDKGAAFPFPHALLSGGARHTLLPGRFGSTGMCAGNSFAEAICQGLCEIFERFAAKHIYAGEDFADFPSIPLDSFAGRAIEPLIDDILSQNLRIIVKDCSLGGRFPVIGAIIIDSAGEGMLRLGSDPDLDVALERCLTESFQGAPDPRHPKHRIPLDIDPNQFQGPPFHDPAKNRLRQFVKSIRSGASVIPSGLLLTEVVPGLPGGFSDATGSSREAFDFVVDRVNQHGGRIFVRDVSFLGFPTFHVFAQGLSDFLFPPVTHAQLKVQFQRIARREDMAPILHLDRCSESVVLECANALEAEWLAARDDPLLFEILSSAPALSWAGGILLSPLFDGSFLQEGDFLLSLLFHRTGQPGRALKYLLDNLARQPCAPDRRRYFQGVAAFFKLSEEGIDPAALRQILETLVGADLAAEILKDLGRREEAFADLRLPECGDCRTCPVGDFCQFEGWRRVQVPLRRALAGARIPQTAAMSAR